MGTFQESETLSEDQKLEKIIDLRERITKCHNCKIRDCYDKPVPCAGSMTARVMFIGEAPGADEVEQGKPFVGRSGKMLRDAVINAGISIDDVFITNVICCRPLNNKFPSDPESINACLPFLREQMEIIRPLIIVAVGGQAHIWVRESKVGITRSCGEWEYWSVPNTSLSVRYLPTLHPSFCMKGPDDRYDNPVMKLDSKGRIELLRSHIASIPEELKRLENR